MGISRLEQFSVQHYARELRAHLPASLFGRAPGRLAWLPIHLAIIVAAAIYVVGASPPWYVALAVAVAAGHSWAGLAFLAHETLHHAVVKSRLVERLVGYAGLGIFCLSPVLWTAWHNQTHHGNAGNPDADPDGFGTLRRWESSAFARALEKSSPGSRSLVSIAFLFVTFSVHSAVVLLVHSHRDGYYARISRRVVYAETAAMAIFWIALLLVVGPWNFLFIYVVPILVANAVTMSYIATNHFLNSLTSINDPLVNTLSVSNPRWLEALHLQFGYHVEHHIFPAVSGRHARAVRDALVRLYGDRYLTLPHARAMHLLYTRPKVHGAYDALVDPVTMRSFNTLAPGALTMEPVGDRAAAP
jgi:fatty acid desaturase